MPDLIFPSKAIEKGAREAADVQRELFERSLELLQPFREAGELGLEQLLGLEIPGVALPQRPDIFGQLFDLPSGVTVGGTPPPTPTGITPPVTPTTPVIQPPPAIEPTITPPVAEERPVIADEELQSIAERIGGGATLGALRTENVLSFLRDPESVATGFRPTIETAIQRAQITGRVSPDITERARQSALPPGTPLSHVPGHVAGQEVAPPIGGPDPAIALQQFPGLVTGGPTGQAALPPSEFAPPNITPPITAALPPVTPTPTALETGVSAVPRVSISALTRLEEQEAEQAILRQASARGILGAGGTEELIARETGRIRARGVEDIFRRNLQLGQSLLQEAGLGLDFTQVLNRLQRLPFETRKQILERIASLGAQAAGAGAGQAGIAGRGIAGSIQEGAQARARRGQELGQFLISGAELGLGIAGAVPGGGGGLGGGGGGTALML